MPEWSGVTTPDTRDQHGDRPTAPFVIAEPLHFDPVAVRPTVAWSPRSHDRLPQTILPAFETGLALTPFLAPLKSRLYGGAALTLTPHAPGVQKLNYDESSRSNYAGVRCSTLNFAQVVLEVVCRQ